MYDKILSMLWDEIYNSDYEFKSNTEKHVIEIKGNQFESSDDSLFLIYYNVYTGEPMVIMQRYDRMGVEIELPSGIEYNVTREEGEDEKGPYTEYTFVLKKIWSAFE